MPDRSDDALSTGGDHPVHLAALVPRAARRWPDAEALVGEVDRLTWREVEERTRRLAGALVDHGIRPGDRVAVARHKSSESFEAVHAILRAGAAVVPVDPLAPPAAARQVLVDADVSGVIGDAVTIAALEPWTAVNALGCVIATGEAADDRLLPWSAVMSSGSSSPLPAIEADQIAYVIYTSGTTGRPKGIVHTHRSGMAYARQAVHDHSLVRTDRVAGMSPLHFDMSTLELYAAPLAGACVVTMGELLMRFAASFTERCQEERVSVWYTVPSVLAAVVRRGGLDRRDLGALRWIGYGGEPFQAAHLRRLMAALPGAEFVNVYGPAEVNACTYHVLERPPDLDAEVPIGRPWAAAEVRIVDESGDDVGPGVAGELLVSATTAMRGYWARPGLTRDCLQPRSDGPPWYRTGDLVERDASGTLWFRGRADHQVKLRGVRLELDWVDAVLARAPGVADAVSSVVDGRHGPDDAHLVAAVVADDGVDVDLAAVRSWCACELPSVAIPRSLSVWSEFPLGPSGKTDRRRVRQSLADAAAEAGDRGMQRGSEG